jgi:hypothetical protein
MNKAKLLVSALALGAAAATPAAAQTTPRQNPIQTILGAIFGDRLGAGNSLDAQWAAGQTPLGNQQYQFESRVDQEVRAGTLTQAASVRLKADYAALVDLEARYGADRRFTTTERADLANRYNTLTQVLAQGGYNDGLTGAAVVAEGQADFNRRVDAQVAARRLTRTVATRLKADYSAVVQLEANYLRDGVISAAERNDLDTRLDALDARVGDIAYVQTPQQRLDAIARALPSSGLTRAAQNQLLVEHADITRLAAAYARLTVTADDQAYLERRLADLELRARVNR